MVLDKIKTDGLATQATGAIAYNASLPLTKTNAKNTPLKINK